ncbi:sensor histidine kinase [Leucobacter sp. UCMA 4100]|uniref:sensor histidine kinase n=1 Tax=Leucobacter sp. UCMA 4100 TaxID=2810534 RepID=UPI0022EB9848|nr:HAMP domain-containing sensor histidine kinase [Leucobacter sp. UCMA 4100]
MHSEKRGARRPGLSARVKLTLSYAGFLTIASALLLAVVWLFLLRYVPDAPIFVDGMHVPNRTDLERAFAPKIIWAPLGIIAFGLIGGWWLAGRMLAPLTQITEAAKLASGGSLTHRIAMPGPRDEFRDLADTFDEMLAEIETHVAEQERFTAAASHELRTPLAITRTMIEVAREDEHADLRALLESLHLVNTRAIDLADALLLLHSSSHRLTNPSPVDVSLLVEEATESLLPLAEKRGISLEVVGEKALVLGAESLLQPLVLNLVHNAIVHNRPSGGGSVTVMTTDTPHGARLTVVNTGVPVSGATADVLLEPFQRAAGRVRGTGDDHAGAGLGLSIVRNIVRVHGGTLDFTLLPEGGARVVVDFAPCVPSQGA